MSRVIVAVVRASSCALIVIVEVHNVNVKTCTTAENNGDLRTAFLNNLAKLQVRSVGHVETFFTDKPVIVDFMFMFEKHQVTVNVNHILTVNRNAISGLVLSADPFWKKPVQN